MNDKIKDLLIVGMGLSGINVSYEARQRDLNVIHIHKAHKGDSTPVAAGLINPITGRRFVKSWWIDKVMPFAQHRYLDLEKLLGGSYLQKMNIVRVFHKPEDENNWLAKSADPYLAEFLLEKAQWLTDKSFEDKLTIPSLIGELQDCFKISLNELQQDYLCLIESEGTLFNETFDYNALEFFDTHISYKGMKFKKVVFSEGWKVLDNPFFENTPFSPSKGELLLVEIPGLNLRKAFKKSMFITPLINDIYWVGATYEWQNFDPTPTETMKKRVLKAFEEMIQIPYTIKQHLSGIRPSSKDRRPVIGPSAVDSRVFTFNGMGTKGSSLAPYFSKVLFDHMYENKPIPKEVHLDRFSN